MPQYNTLEEARAFFRDDRFAAFNGMQIDAVGSDSAECSFLIEPRHLNAKDQVMGGAIFTLADFAAAVAANRNVLSVTQQVSISFLNGARGTRLIARASCRRDSRTGGVYVVDVTDDLGRDVATALVTTVKRASNL